MKTEDLIADLAADPAPARSDLLERRAVLGLGLGIVVTVALFLSTLGVRSTLMAALGEPVVLAKTLLPLALASLAVVLALRSVRPAVPLGAVGWLIWAVPLTAGALFLWAFLATPEGERLRLFIGHSIPVCLPAIVILSLPVYAGFVHALRRGAPLRPVWSGALAGLAAGGIAAAVYSLFCTEDSPLFYAVWYSLGIALATGVGALIGGRLLRW